MAASDEVAGARKKTSLFRLFIHHFKQLNSNKLIINQTTDFVDFGVIRKLQQIDIGTACIKEVNNCHVEIASKKLEVLVAPVENFNNLVILHNVLEFAVLFWVIQAKRIDYVISLMSRQLHQSDPNVRLLIFVHSSKFNIQTYQFDLFHLNHHPV